MPLVLPTSPVPASHINPTCLIIYGAPKVGKSSEILKLKDCLTIDIENGTKYLEGLKVNCSSLKELIELLTLLREPTSPKYKYIAIDTIDRLEEWCEKAATEVYKVSTMGKSFTGHSVLELPNGGGYLWLRQQFRKYFAMIQQCCEYVIFVGHIRDKFLEVGGKYLDKDGTFKTVKESEVNSKDLDLTGKVKSIACSEADAIGHVFRDKEQKLCISFAGSDTVVCGSRCQHLKGKMMEFKWENIYL